MNFNLAIALEIANRAVFSSCNCHLTDVEIIVFKGAWERDDYEEIAAKNQYATSYISQDVAPKLWKVLTDALGEKVKKSNFRQALKRFWEKEYSEQELMNTSHSNILKSIDFHQPKEQSHLEESRTTLYLFPTKSEIPTSELYVERYPIESLCYETLLQPGCLIRVKAPQLMGKTALMERVLAKIAAQENKTSTAGYRAISLSLEMADRKTHLTNLNKFLRWFCLNLSRELGLPNQLEDYWDEEGIGAKVELHQLFRSIYFNRR